MAWQNGSLLERVNYISSILDKNVVQVLSIFTNIFHQEVHTMFPDIVENIFAFFSNNEGWKLHAITENNDPHLFSSIRDFLSPGGRFLEYISNNLGLESESHRYPFSSALLSELDISLLENSLYTTLFNEYLSFFFFIDPLSSSSLSNKLGSELALSRQFAAQQQQNNFQQFNHQIMPDYGDHHNRRLAYDRRLFWEAEVLLNAILEFLVAWRLDEASSNQSSLQSINMLRPGCAVATNMPSTFDPLLVRPTTCQLFLIRAFLKMFYHAAFNFDCPVASSAIAGPCQQNPYQQMFWTKLTAYRRIWAKALCGGGTTSQELDHHHQPPPPSSFYQYQGSASGNAAISNWHQSIALLCYSLLARLSHLLVDCFRYWPTDLSFEVVIETWLTALQPWRYLSTPNPIGSSPSSHHHSNVSLNSSTTNLTQLDKSSSWQDFILSHSRLYLAPLWLFCQRGPVMDLRVYRNAHMAYRVAKVFSQSNLKQVLLDMPAIASNRPIDEFLNFAIDIKPAFQTQSTGTWSNDFIATVQPLLESLASSSKEIRSRMTKLTSQIEQPTGGLWRRFVNLLNSPELEQEVANLRRTEFCLDEAECLLARLFDLRQDNPQPDPLVDSINQPCRPRQQPVGLTISPPCLDGVDQGDDDQTFIRPAFFSTPKQQLDLIDDNQSDVLSQPLQEAGDSMMIGEQPRFGHPHYYDHDNNQQLSPMQRFLIMTRQKVPTIKFTGDRENLPPCTFENRFLVHLTRATSAYINNKLHAHYIAWCSQPGWKGWVSRHLLEVPHQSQPGDVDFHPRLSLRWLANYRLLVPLLLSCLLYRLLFSRGGGGGLLSLLLVYPFGLILVALCYTLVRLALAFLLTSSESTGRGGGSKPHSS